MSCVSRSDSGPYLDEVSAGYALESGWSNTEISDVGEAGIVHGPWGNDVTSVSIDVDVGSSTECTVTWRSWAVYTRDGETDRLYVNGEVVWELVATHSGCNDGWSAGPSDFPNSNSDHPACYYDGSWTGSCSGSITLEFTSDINQAEGDESWGFSHVYVTGNGVTTSGMCVRFLKYCSKWHACCMRCYFVFDVLGLSWWL